MVATDRRELDEDVLVFYRADLRISLAINDLTCQQPLRTQIHRCIKALSHTLMHIA